jgi:hypothetical protein
MSTQAVSQVQSPSQEDIAKAAYYLWEKEGRMHGRDVEHWRQAETQMNSGAKAPAATIQQAAAQALAASKPMVGPRIRTAAGKRAAALRV